jgi:hypothetical protein
MTMPIADTTNATALRRRMLLFCLGLKPGDLREGARLRPVRTSLVLAGAERLKPAEARRFARSVAAKAEVLFQ